MRTKGMNLSLSSVSLDIAVDDQTAMWESLQNCIYQLGNTDKSTEMTSGILSVLLPDGDRFRPRTIWNSGSLT